MSGLKNVPTNPSLEESLLRVRHISDDLNTKRVNLKRKIQIELAKNGSTSNRYKLYQDQLKKIDGMINNLSALGHSLEEAIESKRSASEESNVPNMETYADSLRSVHETIGNEDKLEDIMAEIREQAKLAKKISDSISSPKSLGVDSDSEDEEQLWREVDLIVNEQQSQENLLDNLPSVPNTEPVLNSNSVRSGKGRQTETVSHSNQDLTIIRPYSGSTNSDSPKTGSTISDSKNYGSTNSGSFNSGSTSSGSTNSRSYSTRQPQQTEQSDDNSLGLIVTALGGIVAVLFAIFSK